ncbi:hypothetical protein Pla100_05290 [Neorhodopirellula pilleata]|uniref:Uncharacterized protein n=1 Tax=Neorhodopirellula pilleata TaxID=2714738 RepID=A0A5C6AVX7_9BACT|nr:hypothetical protein Pla100_05290 [Neorhodopirellula pilleata]
MSVIELAITVQIHQNSIEAIARSLRATEPVSTKVQTN